MYVDKGIGYCPKNKLKLHNFHNKSILHEFLLKAVAIYKELPFKAPLYIASKNLWSGRRAS